MGVRCGIDTGGTFTDLVGLDDSSGELVVAKWPSSPANPVESIVGVARESGLASEDLSFLVLGTTVAINALLQRSGAHVIYVTTEGFEDVLHIQRINRRYHYSLEWVKPDPLVERCNCLGVRERINAKGEVLLPLVSEQVEELGQRIELRLAEYEGQDVAISVCLLFSYLNPQHEVDLKNYLESRFPLVPVSVSHEVAPIWREYERGSTVVADAYVKPILKRYVGAIRQSLDRLGVRCPWAIMKSNGGHATAQAAEGQPVNILISGLSGGIIGGKYFGELAQEQNLITLDMGGTSCDVGVVRKGSLSYITNYEVEWGLPISAPFVDLTTIGAGGGSIAWIDKGGFLQVGPQSAGADPGPVCYDRGGTEVTVTDANLVLGRLNPEYFLGGKMELNLGTTQERLAGLGHQLKLSASDAAQAVIDVANENMANAIRLVSIERGLDARDFALVAFGGAGPLHAGGILEKMGMTRVVIPLYPGLCSAFGAVISDFQVDKVWSKYFRSDSVAATVVNDQFHKLTAVAMDELRGEGFTGTAQLERSISMRYAGQNYEHEVEVEDSTVSEQTLQEAFSEFHRLHEQFYGYSISGEVIELIRFKVTATGHAAKPRLQTVPSKGAPSQRQTRQVDFKEQGPVPCPVYHREDLGSGFTLVGPAVVEEVDSTILVHPGQRLFVDNHGVIIIDV